MYVISKLYRALHNSYFYYSIKLAINTTYIHVWLLKVSYVWTQGPFFLSVIYPSCSAFLFSYFYMSIHKHRNERTKKLANSLPFQCRFSDHQDCCTCQSSFESPYACCSSTKSKIIFYSAHIVRFLNTVRVCSRDKKSFYSSVMQKMLES